MFATALAATAATRARPASAAAKFELWFGLSGKLSERIREIGMIVNAFDADGHARASQRRQYGTPSLRGRRRPPHRPLNPLVSETFQ
jgi:hypothetical protein